MNELDTPLNKDASLDRHHQPVQEKNEEPKARERFQLKPKKPKKRGHIEKTPAPNCILEIDTGNATKDALTITFFFLNMFIFLGANNNILQHDGYQQTILIPFDNHCNPTLKHVSFAFTPLKAKRTQIKLLIQLKLRTGLLRTAFNISFDSAITHTYNNHSYQLQRLRVPFTSFEASTPGTVTDEISIYNGFVTVFDELFVSMTFRGEVEPFSHVQATLLHDSTTSSLVSEIYYILTACLSFLLLVLVCANAYKYRRERIPVEFKLSALALFASFIIFMTLPFQNVLSYYTEGATSFLSCLCRAMILWLILHLFMPENTRIIVIIALLSSFVGSVEMSETAVIFASILDLTKLQFPMMVIYDAALVVSISLAYFKIEKERRHKFMMYSILGVLMAATSTFISYKLSGSQWMRMRSTVYLMKRAIMFGFMATITSFHTIVGVKDK